MSIIFRKEVQKLWDYLAIKDTAKKADIILLLSGSTLSPAEKGLELFHKGYAPYIVTNGTKGTFSDNTDPRSDADILGDYLVEHNVPQKNVLREKVSTNTLDGIQLSIKMLDMQHIPHNTIILTARPLHQRRVYATARKQFGQYAYINVPGEEPIPSVVDEVKLEEIAERCCQEYERLILYAKQGDLEGQIIPKEISAAYHEVNMVLEGKK